MKNVPNVLIPGLKYPGIGFDSFNGAELRTHRFNTQAKPERPRNPMDHR